jgi:putative membrane protein
MMFRRFLFTAAIAAPLVLTAPALAAPASGGGTTTTTGTGTTTTTTGTGTGTTTTTTTGTGATGTTAGMAATASDPENAQTLSTLNKGEISTAELALTNGTDTEVRAYAQHMLDDHRANEKDLASLTGTLKYTMVDSDRSRNLKKSADGVMDALRPLKGSAFDRAYIDSQVNMHQDALSMLDRMITEANHAEFKALLTKTRGTISEHLEHARKIQTRMTTSMQSGK